MQHLKNLSMLIAFLVINPVLAEDSTIDSEEKKEETETITIIGTKRIQNLSDTIGDVDLIRESEISQRGIDSIDQIDRVFSDIHIRQRSSRAYNNITLRGQSSVDFYNPAVQLYVDGLPQDQAMFGQMLPQSLRSVEVLYGPQGTLYGRGAIGGVINVNTYKPDNTSRFQGSLTAEQLGYGAGLLMSGALVDEKLFADIAYNHAENDGEMRSIVNNERLGDGEDDWGQARLRYAPDESNLDIMLTIGQHKRESEEEYFVVEGQFDKRLALPVPSHYDLTTDNKGLTVTYEMENSVLKSLTGHQDRTFTRTIFGNFTPEWQKTLSQEIWLSSLPDANTTIDYVVGLYYQDTNFVRRVPAYLLSSEQDIVSTAAFGEMTWHVSKDLSLLAGVRFDKEKVDAKTIFQSLNLERNKDFSATSPKIGFNYNLSPSVTAYGLVSTGFKAGGFTRAVSPLNINFSYDPQKTINYELGLKLAKAEKLTFKSAIYQTNNDDYQLSVGPVTGQFLQNVGKAKSQGVSLSTEWQASSSLTFNASAAYNDSYFNDYNNPLNPNVSIKDNKLPYAPKQTATASVNYAFTTSQSASQWLLRVGLSHVGKTFFDEYNTIAQPSYTLFDASLVWSWKEQFSINLYLNNITDEEYAVYGFDASSAGQGRLYQLGEGRNAGLKLLINL